MAYLCLAIYILGPTYNEFGYNEHSATRSRFLCIKVIDCNVKKFSYNDHPLIYNEQFLLHLFTRCKRDPVYVRKCVDSAINNSVENKL